MKFHDGTGLESFEDLWYEAETSLHLNSAFVADVCDEGILQSTVLLEERNFFPSDICVINHLGLCLIENMSMFPQRLGRPLPRSSTAWIPNHPPGFSSSLCPSSVRLAGRPPGTPSAADVK